MQRTGRITAFTALLLLWPAAGLPAPGDSPLVERERAVLVEVPVQVTVDGKPLAGLTGDNFEVLDRGTPQPITAFDVMDFTVHGQAPADAPPPQVSIAQRRHFLLLFDLAFSAPTSVSKARAAVRDWATEALHPWDLAAVAVYEPRIGARLLLNFTSDREQVDLAIATLGNPRLVDASGDPLGLEIGAARHRFSIEADTARTGMGKSENQGSARQQDALESLALIYHAAYEPVNRHGRRHHISDLTGSLSSMAQMMREVRGRKYVVYLTEGFDASLVFASDDARDIAFLNQASQRGELWKIDTTKRFGSQGAQRELRAMVEEFRRADCVIQAIDLRAETEAGGDRGLSSDRTSGLFFLANETGGKLLRGYNDVQHAMQQVLEQTSVTYLLSFEPADLAADGAFHKIKVRLRGAPRRAKVTHRPGYYAPRPYGERGPEERRAAAAENILQGRELSDLSIGALAAAFPSPAGASAFVPVLIEIDGSTLPETSANDLVLEFYVYALSGSGEIGGFFTRLVTLDRGKLGPQLERNGLKYYGGLELSPGEYSLRVLVREGRTGLSGSRVLPLRVGALDGGGPEMLPPFFPEERGKWLLTRDSGVAERPFPFRFREESFLPAARPAIRSSTGAQVYLVAYNLPQGPLELHARILDDDGAVRGLPRLRLLDRVAASRPGVEVLLASLGPADLPAGRYELQVTIGAPGAGRSAPGSLPLQLVPGPRETESLH